MTETAYATIEGLPCARLVIHVPAVGAWFADVDLYDPASLSGQVTIDVGGTRFVGTIELDHSGEWQTATQVRVIAGGGGWGRLLPARAYHSDSPPGPGGEIIVDDEIGPGDGPTNLPGVYASTIATDAAREAGETLGDFAPRSERVGIDYVRPAGPASRALEDSAGGITWWVDYDGITHVGPRTETQPYADAYSVLSYDPRSRTAVLALDDLSIVQPGAVLDSSRLEEPLVVREVEIEIGDVARVTVIGGASVSGRLLSAFRAVVQRETDHQLYGVHRYRVLRMSGDRVEIQAVDRWRGLPDLSPISLFPGVPGVHAELVDGQELLVSFISGDRTQPVVTHFAGKDGRGWLPTSLILAATDSVLLGSVDADQPAALAPAVESFLNLLADAFDAFCAATPTSMDGGLALQTAVKLVWGPGTPPTPDADVGSSKVLIEP